MTHRSELVLIAGALDLGFCAEKTSALDETIAWEVDLFGANVCTEKSCETRCILLLTNLTRRYLNFKSHYFVWIRCQHPI